MGSRNEYDRTMNRRNFVTALAKHLAYGAGVAATGAGGLLYVKNHIEAIQNELPHGKYLSIVDSPPRVHISDNPQPVRIVFSSVETHDLQTKGKVAFRRSPQTALEDPKVSKPSDIGTKYAARVIGGTYIGPLGNRIISHNLKQHEFGLWFVLTDEAGRLVSISGKLLEKDEQPYFVSANFVSIPPEPSTKPQPR